MQATVKKVTAEVRGGLISLHEQEFKKGEDGALVHFTDGNLRASVPPEGWDEYLELWPEAAPVVASLRNVKSVPTVAKSHAEALAGTAPKRKRK
jgi:hypothetical protein